MKANFKSNLNLAATMIIVAFQTTACQKNESQAGWWQAEQERIELSHQVELKKFRFDQLYSGDFKEFESLRLSADQTALKLDSLRRQRVELGGQLESLQKQTADFKAAAVRSQRHRAMSRTFEKLDLVSGRSFENVSVASIDDAGVTIRHADGSARLRYADLDAEKRVWFGLEEDLALTAQNKETQDAAAYEKWVDARMVAMEEKKTKNSESTRQQELASAERQASLAARHQAAVSNRPLAQKAASVGDRTWGDVSTYRTSRPTYRYVYYNNTPAYYGRCLLPVNPTPARAARNYYIDPQALRRNR